MSNVNPKFISTHKQADACDKICAALFPKYWKVDENGELLTSKEDNKMVKKCYQDKKGNWHALPKDATYVKTVRERKGLDGKWTKEILSEGYEFTVTFKDGTKRQIFKKLDELQEKECQVEYVVR